MRIRTILLFSQMMITQNEVCAQNVSLPWNSPDKYIYIYKFIQQFMLCFQVKYLSSLGGDGCNATLRKITEKLGTQTLWQQYSVKGRKGKLALNGLPIYLVILSK